jgi:hypothetical protein
VIFFTRSLSRLADLPSAATRRMALALVSMVTVSLTVLLAAAPAGAFISGEFGLQQRKPVFLRPGPLQYHGGPVIHASDSYAIYWDPDELYNAEWMRIIDKYFQNAGSGSGGLGDVFSVNAQYGETGYSNNPSAPASAKEAHAANQSTFRGAYTATDPYPSSGGCTVSAQIACLTDQEIKTELQKVIKSGALPGATGTVPGAKSTPVYYLLTPPGVTVCAAPKGPGTETPSTCSNSPALESEANEIKEGKLAHRAETGICGYHSTIEPHGATPIVYAVQPWVAGLAGFYEDEVSASVLACQANTSPLEEPNQLSGLSFASYGAGLADVIVGDLANEQSNIVVNPLLSGWYQNASAAEGGSPEQGDMCQFNFGPPPETPPVPNPQTHAAALSDEEIGSGAYYAHWAFNSSGLLGKGGAGCWQGVDLEPHITAPNPVNVGDVVGLDANESDLTLDAAPLDTTRPQKEEVRVSDEVLELGGDETRLEAEISKLEAEEGKLSTKISELSVKEATLESELPSLAKEEKRVATEEATLAKEREYSEAHGGPTKTEEEKFATTEKKLTEEQKRITGKKATDETSKTSDEDSKGTDEKEEKDDNGKKLIDEQDKQIVIGDKGFAKAEEKLAKEDKLIKEREPFLAPIYKWDFGYQENGKEVTEEGEEKASVFHTFPCAKTYKVELTVIDGGDNEQGLPESKGIKEITVVGGKPCEESSSGGSGGPGGSGGTSGTTSPATSTTGSTTTPSTTTSSAGSFPAKPIPGPVASTAVVSHSLLKALKSGLVVNYSVNEQVAGQFQVLLADSVAKRIGLHGAPAVGMPPGSTPSIVIAKAILITTKGGRDTVKILFGKQTAAKLRKLRSVSLTVRLVVRNASSHSPLSTTVISTVNLFR